MAVVRNSRNFSASVIFTSHFLGFNWLLRCVPLCKRVYCIQVDARDACLLGSPLMADRCLDDKLSEKCRELELMVIPLACETTGVWCTEGAEFLNELGRRTSIITGDKHETAYLFQRLSVAIQRGDAACFYNCFSNFDNLCE